MANVILSCEHLKKSYQTPEGEKVVIEDISLSVKENEFVVLFGAGQCGKGYKEWVRVSDGGPALKVRCKLA